ncbi:molybdenum cofactor biosynthesis protein MoaC [Desulfocarbo indianensis]|nr:molybdenum cofactor biosynthesis protein MoaC [Desulfocarbo indianensis]
MVDVSGKEPTKRRALARGLIRLAPETVAAIAEGRAAKGDVLAVARVAGIMAAKRTPELIPLCHPLPISSVRLELTPREEGVLIEAEVITTAPTGVEMEAMTAVSVAALTVYDMIKAVQKDAVIDQIFLVEKSGGKSGEFRRSAPGGGAPENG